MEKQANSNLRYNVAVAFLMDMFDCHLIDEMEYRVLETKFAVKYMPFFRYEKPCKSATLPVTQTGQEGGNLYGTQHPEN